MILLPEELVNLTGKEKPSAQARELDHLAIPYRRRRDGTLVVLRVHLEGATMPRKQDSGPRLRLYGSSSKG